MKIAAQRKMKPSGVDWIGDVPEGWGIVRVKYTGWYRNGLTYAPDDVCDEDEGVLVLRSSNIQGGKLDYADSVYVNKTIPRELMTRVDDIVICSRNGSSDLIGKNAIVNDKRVMTFGAFMMTYRVESYFPRFAYWMLNSCVFKYYRSLFATSTVNQLTGADFGNITVPVPPLDEQKRIAAKLDRLCGRVDELAENIKGEIAALQEYRKSLITECVTKGLNPKAKMKPSGVDWIGGVPEGWGIDKFCYRFDFAKGLNITKQDLTETGVPVVSYGQIHSKRNDGVHLTDELLRHIPVELTKGEYAARLKRNDFVFADTSEDVEGIGNCVTVNRDEAAYAGYHTLIARPIEKVDCGYFGYLFKSECWRQQLRRKANSVKVYSISQRLFKGGSILLPPLDEQSRIATFLDKRCAVIDAKIAERQRQLEKLGEYRSSVIYEYVTGKREVSA